VGPVRHVGGRQARKSCVVYVGAQSQVLVQCGDQHPGLPPCMQHARWLPRITIDQVVLPVQLQQVCQVRIWMPCIPDAPVPASRPSSMCCSG
jgi:hypothetical protein